MLLKSLPSTKFQYSVHRIHTSSPSAFAQGVPSSWNTQPWLAVHHYLSDSYLFFRPKSALSSAFWSPHAELVVFSVWEERSWWIQSLPSTKPVRLPLALSETSLETSLINRPVGTCLNFPESVRTNWGVREWGCTKEALESLSFFFFSKIKLPQTLKTLNCFLLVT